MNEIIKLIAEFKVTKSDKTFSNIFTHFIPLMRSYCKTIYDNYKDDLFQELSMGLCKVIDSFHINKNSIMDFETFKKRVEVLLCDQIIQNNCYLKNFFGIIIKNIDFQTVINEEVLFTLYLEYILFCNQNQFIYCLNKRLKFIYQDFIRKHRNYFWHELRVENSLNYFEDNPSKKILSFCKTSILVFLEENGFLKSEIEFLILFIENGILLSEANVGKKIGMLQQAIHTRKKTLCKKYHGFLIK